MNLEEALEKVVEHAHEELHIVRKRAEEKTAGRGTTARITTKPKRLPIDWTITHTSSIGYMMLNTKTVGGTRV